MPQLTLIKEKDGTFTLIMGDAKISMTREQAEAVRDVLTVKLKVPR